MAPLPKSVARQHTAFLLCLFSSLVVSFALFTYFMLLPLSQFSTHHHTATVRNKSLVPADLRDLQNSSKMVEFALQDAYNSLSREHDDLWDAMLPHNGGHITLAQGRNKSVGDEKVGLAMFHQLQCLATIRSEMQHLYETIQDPSRRDTSPRHEGATGSGRKDPMECFDYLRQSILCMADGTIERPRRLEDGDYLIDGLGERRCRDWDILFKASERSDEKPVMADDLR